MILQFLGTGAADYSRTILEDFPDRFDQDIRRASAAVLNGRYLIDAGPHVLNSIKIAGIDAPAITDLFFTHFHKDHFNPSSVAALAAGRKTPLRIWFREDALGPGPAGSETAGPSGLSGAGPSGAGASGLPGAVLAAIPGVELHPMRLHESCRVNERLTVAGLPANHGQDSFPQHLLFEADGKRLYYALDGAWVENSAFRALKEAHLALLVLDGTCGDYIGDFRAGEHNSIPMVRLLLPSFRTAGVVDKHTAIYISHLARTLHKSHAETAEIAAASGFRVACDGLTVEV